MPDTALTLAALRGPAYEPMADAEMRSLGVENAQLRNQAAAQGIDLGAQQLQAAKYANQETATQLAEQQAWMKAMQDEQARATGTTAPAAPAAAPLASSGPVRTPEGFIVRDPDAPAAGDFLPGMAGVTAGTAAQAAPGNGGSAAPSAF